MSISVDQLFKEFKLEYSSPHKWNQKIEANFNGVYIVSLSSNPKKSMTINEIDVSTEVFNSWLKEAPNLEIENAKVTKVQEIRSYLNKFWHKTENIIYIGESTSQTNPIQNRVNQYYTHKVGQKGPHTGGYWIKLLSCLDDLYVYFAQCLNPREMEFKMILRFAELITGKSIFEIENLSKHFPFGNLKVDLYKKNTIKNHINTNTRKTKTAANTSIGVSEPSTMHYKQE